MNIGITFTGIDDYTNLDELVRLHNKYKMIEYGVLIGYTGSSKRFPSDETLARIAETEIPLSIHVVGKLVREVIRGDWSRLTDKARSLLAKANRIQLNVSPYNNIPNIVLPRFGCKEIIIQQKAEDIGLAKRFEADGAEWISCLIDNSGGRGKCGAIEDIVFPCMKTGFAGGIGISNCVEVATTLMKLCCRDTWIDMESKVRDSDDKFSISKCNEVCERLSEAGILNIN